LLEAVQDIIGNSGLLAGNYININYNDSTGLTTITATGLQPSGNYANAIHTHTSSDIIDFNSSVSGLLPTIANSGNNRILTSDGTKYGINAESNLTFEDYVLTIQDSTKVQPAQIQLFNNDAGDGSAGLLILNSENQPRLELLTNDDQDINFLVSNGYPLNIISYSGPISCTTYGSGLFVDNIRVSVSGHTHTSSNITDFNSSVSGLLPIIANSGNNRVLTSDGTSTGINAESYLTFDNNTATLNVGSSGMDNNSSNINLYGRSSDDDKVGITIKDSNNNLKAEFYWNGDEDSTVLKSYVDKLILSAPVFDGGVFVSTDVLDMGGDSSSGIYISTSNNLFVNNVPVSVSGHSHTSSEITNFNSSVSGLLPVKDIVGGSGINVSSLSGTYTVAVTGIAGLISEEVDDRVSQLLVEGTGVNLTYNDASGTLTIDNLHTEINVLSQEPQGFVNRNDSIISFNDSTRTFTIAPSGSSYDIYIEGVKVTKTSSESIVIPTGTALNYLHFDTTTGLLHNKTTEFNFDTDVPIAYIHWNADINQSTFFGEERHGIRMDSVTHKWIHNTFGMQYIRGLSIGNYVLLGDGSSNSHAQIDISDGILYQEDIIIDITNDNGINSANEFVQTLNPIAYIPTYYHSGSTGQWVRDIATAFPVKYNATRAQYNLFSGGTWTTPNVTNDRFFAMWIVATNDINDPILAIVGQRQDSSLNSAESNNNWNDINLTNIPTQEIRPLYRLIFKTNSTYTNTPKSSLQSILDIRVAIQSTVAGVVQNDHGSLFGLADDDHSQYVHIDNNRTISALHTFSNGLNAGGLINATSGNFTSLTVNSTGVSLNGHTHTSSNITDFNSSVSGLLPSVSGSGYVNSSFNNNVYTISVSGLQPSGNYANAVHTHSSSDITDFNTSVSGLLPSISGSGYVSSSFDNNIYTISVTGLQPSGNYSLVGHNHTSNDITDFNSSVSGLLPVTNIVGGTNVSVSASGTVYTISASGTGTTITNASDNRVLTSTGTSTGINAENNLTFDGTNLVITGNIGIGTGVLSEKLEVAGNIKANNIIHPFLLGGM
jgi:hypothetical protein